MFEHELSAVDMKKKMMLSARVRRGSYTLEEPSPYLIKNKNDHMYVSSFLPLAPRFAVWCNI